MTTTIRAALIVSSLSLAACDSSQTELPAIDIKSQPAPVEEVKSVKSEKLNLEVTHKMMDEALAVTTVSEVGVEMTPALKLHKSKEKQRVQLKGEVLMDDAEEDYIEAVKGVVLEVEVRFE
jgi:hypothetical protein